MWEKAEAASMKCSIRSLFRRGGSHIAGHHLLACRSTDVGWTPDRVGTAFLKLLLPIIKLIGSYVSGLNQRPEADRVSIGQVLSSLL
jgi:hypothetical protein